MQVNADKVRDFSIAQCLVATSMFTAGSGAIGYLLGRDVTYACTVAAPQYAAILAEQ